MRHFTNIYKLFFLLLLPLLHACSSAEDPEPTPQGKVHHFVNLTVQVASSRTSRAADFSAPKVSRSSVAEDENYPTVTAEERESAVSSITVFIYDGIKDIDNDDDAAKTIVRAFHWKVTPTTSTTAGTVSYTTGSRALPDEIEEGQPYCLLVVANADLSQLDGTSLEMVREYIYEGSAFTVPVNDAYQDFNPNRANDFIMASTKVVQLKMEQLVGTIGGAAPTIGTEDNPYKPDEPITIERLAARVDFAIDPTNYHEVKDATTDKVTDHWYEYPVTGDDGLEVGTFRLKYVVPFNLTQQQYLFKHTTVGTNTAQVQVPGRETRESDGSVIRATNYVLDPMTLKQDNPGSMVGTYYVPYLYHENLGEEQSTLLSRFQVTTNDNPYLTPWTNSESKALKYFIIGYSGENAVTVNLQQSTNPAPSSMLPGIRFYGIYHLNGADASTDREVAFDYLIRHSMTSGTLDASQPMAYGMVRNNIYRVYIRSIHRLKDDFFIHLQVAVLPWQYYKHSDIYM